MSIDDTSDSPIQFGLADKSLKVLQEHSRRLEAMVTAVKGTVGAGVNSQFSGKFLQVANQQLLVQKDIARGMSQLNITMSNIAQLARMGNKMAEIDLVKIQKNILAGMNALNPSGGGGGVAGGRMAKVWDFLKDLPSKIMSGLKKGIGLMGKIWEKTGAKFFKATGKMGLNKLLGLGGATIIGALVGKMISSSPLLQAMFKIMNSSLTLIMRPIGDFFGAFIRPMSIYFLKEVAIPFFQQGKGWMKIGEKWGKIAVGFFVNPGMAMKTAMLQAAREIPILSQGISENAKAEADFFQGDPAAWARVKAGIDATPAFMMASAEIEVAKKAEELVKVEEDIVKETEKLKTLIQTQVAKTGYTTNQIMTGTSDASGMYMRGEIDINELSRLASLDLYRWSNMEFDPKTGDLTAGGPLTYSTQEIEDQKQVVEEQKQLKARNMEQQKQLSRLDNSIFKGLWELFTKGPGGGGVLGESDAMNTLIFNSRNEMIRDWGEAIKEWAEDTSHLDNASYAAGATEENFEDILRSTEAMVELTQIAKDATEVNTRTISDMVYSTGLKNEQILRMYGLTVDDIGETSEELKQKLFDISSVYQAVGTDAHKHRDEILKVQDEAIELNKKYNLGLNEHYLKAANINGQYATKAMTAYDQVISRIVAWEHMNVQAMAVQQLSLARQSDMMTQMFTDKPGTLVNDTIKILTNSMMGLSSTTHPWIQGGANDPAAMNAVNNSTLQNLLNFVGPQGFEHMISQGQYFTETGKLQQSFQYRGPEGQIVKSLSQVPSTWNTETQGYDREEGWERIPDMQTALINATVAAQSSMSDIQNQLAAQVREGTQAFSTSVESQAYVKAGGGFDGLVAAQDAKVAYENAQAEVKKAEASAALAASGMQVLTIGGVSYTVPANQSSVGSWTNPAAIPVNLSGVGQGGVVSGGGSSSGQGSNYSGSSNPAAAAAAAGYSTGSATNAQFGGIIDEPIIGIGMHSGKEWNLGESGHELVTPLNQLQGGGGLGNIIIHIGNISREADYMKLKPLIQRWILEASSRRGMV